ncbi:hypothetical protein PYCC9005_002322 [Savitreella phatthalungensis]
MSAGRQDIQAQPANAAPSAGKHLGEKNINQYDELDDVALEPDAADRHSVLSGTDRSTTSTKVDPTATGQLVASEQNAILLRKMSLFNHELDAMGFGRYQLCIFLLCGMGYFIDLMFAQLFGIILPPMQRELGVPTARIGDISTCFSVGLTIGAFSWGILVDVIGRRWAFNLTCLISSTFGILIAAPRNYGGICALALLCGIGVGGNIPIDSTITLEFLPKKNRFLLAALSVFQPLGVVICSVLAFGLVPPFSCDQQLDGCSSTITGKPPTTPCCTYSSNKGWRYLTVCVGGITFFIFFVRFVIFKFQESPKYLLTRGRDAEALAALQYIAKFNRQECKLTIEDIDKCGAYKARDAVIGAGAGRVARDNVKYYLLNLRGLFRTRHSTRITLTVWVIYMSQFWGFSMAGFLQLILSNLGVAEDIPISQTYRNYIIINICGVPGVLMASALMEVPKLGRKWSMFGTSLLMALGCFLFVVVNNEAGRIGFSAMEYFGQSAFNSIVYGTTPELFPAQFRGSACGFAATTGRIMSFIAPQIGARVLADDPTGKTVLYLAGAGVLVSSAAVLFLPRDVEARGKEVF